MSKSGLREVFALWSEPCVEGWRSYGERVTKRLFIGLEVSSACAETLVALDAGAKGVEWLPAERLHLPLSLHWTVGQEEEQRLRDALDEVQVAPFFLPITGLRSHGRAPSVAISVGVGKGHPHFFALHRFIQDAVLRAQLQADLKPFHPEIIVARASEPPQGKFLKFLRENADAEFCLLHMQGFALFQVDRGPLGSDVEVAERWAFAEEG